MLNLEICSGTSCHLMGCSDLKQVIENLPSDIQGEIKVISVSCLGHCQKGPNIKLGETLYHRVTPKLLKELILKQLGK